jgi:hypothetical protein
MWRCRLSVASLGLLGRRWTTAVCLPWQARRVHIGEPVMGENDRKTTGFTRLTAADAASRASWSLAGPIPHCAGASGRRSAATGARRCLPLPAYCLDQD